MSRIEKIQCTNEFLKEENIGTNISELWRKAVPILEHRKELYNCYTRKNDTSDVIVPLEFYIGTIASGYFAGKEPQYQVKNVGETQQAEEFQTMIEHIAKYNDNSGFFYDCVKDYLTTGACYGLLYENNDNEIVYAHTSSLKSIAIWNYETPSKKIGLLQYWTEKLTNERISIHLQFTSQNYKRHYVGEIEEATELIDAKVNFKEVTEDSKEVLWKDLPVFAVENPDGLALFENAIGLIKNYEQTIISQSNDNSKLKITGFTPNHNTIIETTDEKGNPIMIKNPARIQEDEAILNAKVFYTPDDTGDISWITKPDESQKKDYFDLALMISGIPNMFDPNFFNVENSSTFEKKFIPLEQLLQQADKLFKKELLRMWGNIINRINIKKSTAFDFRDIEIILARNLKIDMP